MNAKQIEEQFFKGLTTAVTTFIIVVLLYIFYVILKNGLPALNWDMVSKLPKGGFYFGKEGGILNAIVGSFYISFSATFLAFIIGLPVALYMNVYLVRRPRFLTFSRLVLDALWGVPSIVYGAFGFAIMIYFGLRTSLLAGIIAVTLLIIPIMIRAMDEVLRTIPKGLMEASLALGSTKTETAFKVFFRQGLPGFITAILLSFGRGIGDAASVLFTAGYTDHIPQSLSDPVATLPLAIFFQLGSPIPEVRERAYAAAVILIAIILIISFTARFLSKKYNKHQS
jgi:phosphate transport system permease protein